MKRPAWGAGRFGEERYCYVGLLLYVISEGSLVAAYRAV